MIDLHHNLRSFQVKNSLRRKSSAFPKLNIEKWIRVNLKLNRLPETHVVDRYFKAAEKAGVKNDGEGLDFFIPTKTHVDLLSSGCENGKFTAFAIGGKFGTKKMPAEKIASICKKIKGRIVLLGGAEDVLVANEIARICGETIVNLCGTLSLFESAFVIKQSRLLVSHDTGLMHIGAALKKEIVSLWGNTIPEFGMSPYYGTHSVRGMISEVKHLDCRPCSKIGFAACPKGHFKCMLNQNEEAIAGFVNGVV